MAASGADLGVVVAFGQLLPESLLDALPLGFVNVHFSLLPRWRGAAPVERAILAGDAETGVCVMELEPGPRHRRGVRARGDADRPDGDRGRAARRGSSSSAPSCSSTRSRICRRSRPSRSPASRPTPTSSRSRSSSSTRRGRPPSSLRVIRAGNPRPGAWTDRRRQAAEGLARDRVARRRARSCSLDVQPEGRAPHVRSTTWSAAAAGGDPFELGT